MADHLENNTNGKEVTSRGGGAESLNTPAKVQASKQAETDKASRGVTRDKSAPEVIDNPHNGV